MSDQKQALVIGGTSGIGKQISKQLLERNYAVHILSRSEEGTPDAAKHISGDILEDDWQDKEFPETIDALVYAPGTINLKPFRSLKAEDFRNDFEINVMGAVKALQHFQKELKKADSPSVILFSTVAVQQGMPFHASISSAKGALEGLVRTLAAEWAPKIRVNAIAPSLVDTPMAEKLLSSDSKRENADDRHPLKRVGQPEDIAEMATFLLSEKAAWISGQIVGVDGGLSSLRV
jgi:NAD(P)-dependent dehydrogenase (short-subunit alcohol dehydrogenase family)